MNKDSIQVIALAGLLALVSLPAFATNAEPLTTKITTGVFYSEGQNETSGSSSSTMTAVPLSLSWRQPSISASVSTSYLSTDTGGSTASGQGDTTFSLGFDVFSKPWVTLKGKYKLATGDENKGLSTGKDDLSLQVDLFQPLSAKSSLFATIGHKFVGKVSGQSMQDSNYLSLGGGYLPASGISLGVSVDYHEATYTTLDDSLGASLFLDKRLTKNWNLSLFGGYDNTDTASLGSTLTYKF